MGPTWVLLVPDGPHVGPMNFAIRVGFPVHSLQPSPGPCLNIKAAFPGMGILITKITQPWDCVIYIMAIPILVYYILRWPSGQNCINLYQKWHEINLTLSYLTNGTVSVLSWPVDIVGHKINYFHPNAMQHRFLHCKYVIWDLINTSVEAN